MNADRAGGVVAWMLRRKSDGFVRAIYKDEPSKVTFDIAELDGDEYVCMVPQSLLIEAQAEVTQLTLEKSVLRRAWDYARGIAERAEADAERYRWLRDSDNDWDDAGIVRLNYGDYDCKQGADLDTAIDKARGGRE